MKVGQGLFSTAALFAGAGGLERGLETAGFRPVVVADNDPAAQAVLRVRFPEAKLFSNVGALESRGRSPEAELLGDVAALEALPEGIDLVTAGFPCQDLSMAGNKKGLNGAKSSAVDGLFSLVEASPPPVVLIENVYFMLHLDGGAAMASLVERFERLGYRWAYRVVDSRSLGLPQRRRRVFFLAMRDREPGDVLFADDAGPAPEAAPSLDAPIGFYWTEGASGHGITREGVPPLKAGSGIGIASPPAVLFPNGAVLRPTIETAERLQGLSARWTEPAAEAGFPHLRWRLVGNAVSPPVASWLGDRLRTPGSPLGMSTELPQGVKWPRAAFGEAGRRWARDVSERPKAEPALSLHAFEDTGWEPLSLRALSGFIGRARSSTLRYPPGFLKALETAASALSPGDCV